MFNFARRSLLPALTMAPAFAGLFALSMPATSEAFCGFYAGKADASLFNEASQVILARDGKRTVMSMLNDYKGPLKEFALVIPTPVALKQGQVRIAEKISFERLDAYSSPRLAEYFDNDPCQLSFNWGMSRPMPTYAPAPRMAMEKGSGAERARALGVTVEARYTLEEYDIVSLSAKQSGGLEIWLRENGYRIPKGAAAAFKPYINQGMHFFVAKVNLKEQQKTGFNYLRPLQFAYESEKFMLPIRLGMINAVPDKAQDLIIYVLSREGRVESSNYRTVKLPANVNLPPFIKPQFKDFYKAMFDNQAVREDYRVLFTEYFWDMSWCDPCAANPLTPQELKNAGAFWAGGNAEQAFQEMQRVPGSKSAPAPAIAPVPPPQSGDARPAMLTRLHVRYTSASFPEDLMFTQTQDRQNWQTRYVIQNPYGGSSEQCMSKLEGTSCEKVCSERVEEIARHDGNYAAGKGPFAGKDKPTLAGECMDACRKSKGFTLERVKRYYSTELPERMNRERQTLGQLTGWSLADIDRMPGATR